MTIEELYETVAELIDLDLVEEMYDPREGCVRLCPTSKGLAVLIRKEKLTA